MAIDLKKIDKKKASVIILAAVAGLIAVALTGKYIDQEVSKGPDPEILDAVSQHIRQLEHNNRKLQEQQQAIARQLEQRMNSLAQEVRARPREPERVIEEPVAVKRSLAYVMPRDKRALTLRINTLSAVGGLLSPGDFVDILAHLNVPGQERTSEERRTTVTLFQNIQVLAVGPSFSPSEDFESQQRAANLIVTFAVDPRQAELLTFAEKNGHLQLVLRSPDERAIYHLGPTNWKALGDYIRETQDVEIDVADQKIEEEKEVERPSIQVIRGGEAQR